MLTQFRLRLLPVLLLLLATSCSNEDSAIDSAVTPIGPTLPRIAHAGGGIGQRVYNNSREAIEHNLARGFTWFELDFLWTSDNQLVTFHDWDLQARRDFGFVPEQVPDLATFQQWVQEHASQQRTSQCCSWAFVSRYGRYTGTRGTIRRCFLS